MNRTTLKAKVEYGDFQTPLELSKIVCQKLLNFGINPDLIIEPTCGIGNFIESAANAFKSTNKIIGLEININYLQQIKNKQHLLLDERIELNHGNFFDFDWSSVINEVDREILVLGNFPWVTNSKQGTIDGGNLPHKNNFQKHQGLDAITGKSNFDISEWMLIQVIHWLQNREASLAMLCKTSVSRKILNYLHTNQLNLSYCATYQIDTQKYFNANVEASLLFCKFDANSKIYFCDVFSDLKTASYLRIGYRNNILIRDINTFDKLDNLYDAKSKIQWRSGVKHDCSNVMELKQSGDTFINGLGEVVNLEKTYIFPLLKGSDVAQNRTKNTERFMLVTQRFVGETTENIKSLAPQTWNYLEAHAKYLDNRKSKIYQHQPRFSIFGIGSYTFSLWKIAICGLYKKLEFRLISPINNQPVIFDDTVYFLSFEDEKSAVETFHLLTSTSAINFYSSLIFWDEKRPIKSSILNSLNLKALKLDLSNS